MFSFPKSFLALAMEFLFHRLCGLFHMLISFHSLKVMDFIVQRCRGSENVGSSLPATGIFDYRPLTTRIGPLMGSTQYLLSAAGFLCHSFFSIFAFLMILSSSQCFVTYLYSFIKGKQVGSTQIPPTLYALCFDSFTVLFPVNGSCCIFRSLLNIQSARINNDMVRLWFSSADCLNHHVQDALLWVELNSFWF